MVFNRGHPSYVVLIDADHQSENKKIEVVMIFPQLHQLIRHSEGQVGKIVWSLPGAPMDLKVKMDLNVVQVGCRGGYDRIFDLRKLKCAQLLKCVELIDFSPSFVL